MRAAKVQASLRIRAVLPEPPLLAHTSSESRGTYRQKARSLASLNGWVCAVKICHDKMLEDTNSLDAPQLGCCTLVGLGTAKRRDSCAEASSSSIYCMSKQRRLSRHCMDAEAHLSLHCSFMCDKYTFLKDRFIIPFTSIRKCGSEVSKLHRLVHVMSSLKAKFCISNDVPMPCFRSFYYIIYTFSK